MLHPSLCFPFPGFPSPPALKLVTNLPCFPESALVQHGSAIETNWYELFISYFIHINLLLIHHPKDFQGKIRHSCTCYFLGPGEMLITLTRSQKRLSAAGSSGESRLGIRFLFHSLVLAFFDFRGIILRAKLLRKVSSWEKYAFPSYFLSYFASTCPLQVPRVTVAFWDLWNLSLETQYKSTNQLSKIHLNVTFSHFILFNLGKFCLALQCYIEVWAKLNAC